MDGVGNWGREESSAGAHLGGDVERAVGYVQVADYED
jgi:hypothetical protein